MRLNGVSGHGVAPRRTIRTDVLATLYTRESDELVRHAVLAGRVGGKNVAAQRYSPATTEEWLK
jgi:hypothetical protein